MNYAGFDVVLDTNLVDRVVDWSRCRSPSRAMRRHKRGFRTRMFIAAVPQKLAYQVGPNKLAMHPAMWAALKARVA